MATDVFFVLGIVALLFCVPSFISAFLDRRIPKVAIVLLVSGAGLVVLAVMREPSLYTFALVPEAFLRVVAAIIR